MRMGALRELQSDFSYRKKMAKYGRARGTRLQASLAKKCPHVSYIDTVSGNSAYKLLVSTPVFVECCEVSQHPDQAKSQHSRSHCITLDQRHGATRQLQKSSICVVHLGNSDEMDFWARSARFCGIQAMCCTEGAKRPVIGLSDASYLLCGLAINREAVAAVREGS